jgi:hypothetical protein
VHLYGDPTRIPAYIDDAHAMMRAHCYQKLVLADEYNRPAPIEFPDVEAVLQEVLASAFAEAPATQRTAELTAQAAQQTPERRAVAAPYARLPDLPPKLQMFMSGCSPEL